MEVNEKKLTAIGKYPLEFMVLFFVATMSYYIYRMEAIVNRTNNMYETVIKENTKALERNNYIIEKNFSK